MANSKIEWTDETLQLTTGCTKASAGCANCYAERMHKRLQGMGHADYQQEFSEVRLHPSNLVKIAKLPAGKRVFVNSMSDLFHEHVPFSFIFIVFKEMAKRPDVTFQILTKRAERMSEFFERCKKCGDEFLEGRTDIPKNIWLGVTVEDQQRADERIPHHLSVPAAVRFVSIEPMLGPVNLPTCTGRSDCKLNGIDGHSDKPLGGLNWVICGGETGPGARPMHPDWVRTLRDQCTEAAVPFFFKGWGEWAPGSQVPHLSTAYMSKNKWRDYGPEGGEYNTGGFWCNVGKKAAGRTLDGRTWEEFPV
ncbi:MAG TPA: phage Gp37/Gp68 family protein [Nitrospirota bacterium]